MTSLACSSQIRADTCSTLPLGWGGGASQSDSAMKVLPLPRARDKNLNTSTSYVDAVTLDSYAINLPNSLSIKTPLRNDNLQSALSNMLGKGGFGHELTFLVAIDFVASWPGIFRLWMFDSNVVAQFLFLYKMAPSFFPPLRKTASY